MSTTKETKPRTDRAIAALLEAKPIHKHRESLHRLMVGYLRNSANDPMSDEVNEDVSLTYYLLLNLLAEMEGGGEKE